jgi:hypothetical protein
MSLEGISKKFYLTCQRLNHVSIATPIVDSLTPINPLFPTLFILSIVFPILSLGSVLLIRNSKFVSARTVGAVALFLGGLGLVINLGVIVMLVALQSSGAAGLIVILDMLLILGLQVPTIYIGYSKLRKK